MFDNKVNEGYFHDESNKFIFDDENSVTSSSNDEEFEVIKNLIIKNKK